MEAYGDEFPEISARWQAWVDAHAGALLGPTPKINYPGERSYLARIAELEGEKAARDRLIAQLTDAMKMRSEPGVFSRPEDNGPVKSLSPNFRSQPDRYYPARLATSGETD